MFGNGDTPTPQNFKVANIITSSTNVDAPSSPQYSLISDVDHSLHEKSYIQCKFFNLSQICSPIEKSQEYFFSFSFQIDALLADQNLEN